MIKFSQRRAWIDKLDVRPYFSICRRFQHRESFFDLSQLPERLRQEFDQDDTARTYSNIVRGRKQIRVHSSWVLPISWKCQQCCHVWYARLSDRLSVNGEELSGCPHCRRRKSASSPLLCAQFPSIASQWDHQRNSHHVNNVRVSLSEIQCSSSVAVWWKCDNCFRSWRESAKHRVKRFSLQQNEEKVAACPECERLLGIKNSLSVSAVLADDPYLLSEVRLAPHQDPKEICLNAGTLLKWHCSYCEADYTAPVANRHLYNERCPQCTGVERTPLNLLVVQRPDVVKEISSDISSTALSKLTIRDARPLTFVCRKCLSVYRMPLRTRCMVPKGYPGCPKCFLRLSASLTVPRDSSVPASKKIVKKRLRELRLSNQLLSKQAKTSNSEMVAKHELMRRDRFLRN